MRRTSCALPVGNAGNITAYWRGFVEYYRLENSMRKPRIWGFQAAGAAPIVLGHPVDDPQTVASAIRIGNPASWQSAIAAKEESGGAIDAVTDEEILSAYRRRARKRVSSANRRRRPASPACLSSRKTVSIQRARPSSA